VAEPMKRPGPKDFTVELRKAYPGRKVDITPELAVMVYPVGMIHLQKFTASVTRAVATLLGRLTPDMIERPGVGAPEGTKVKITTEGVRVLVPALVEVITGDLLELVGDCCVPPIDLVPHWHLADIVTAWAEESFGEERKLRPWVRAMEALAEKLTGEKIDLWEKLSQALSPAVIQSMRSSISGALGGRTPAGASPSSGSTSSAATSGSDSGEQTSSTT
jgi:hypothetical protein